MKKFTVSYLVSLLLPLLFAVPLNAEELNSWPREVKVTAGSITIYQPQVESLNNNILKGRAAVAYNGQGEKGPVFGVAWFTSKVQIDRGQRIVQYETMEITDTRFPDDNKQLGEEFSQAVKDGMKSWNLQSSLDDLTTALAAIGQEQKEAANLKTDPPDILYVDKPALLVTIDGKEVLQKIKNSQYQAVANTPYPLFFDSKDANWYLNAADKVWYRAKAVDGPWTFDEQPPTDLAKMVATKAEQSENKTTSSDKTITADNAPAIVVAHKPTELVVSTGKAQFEPLTDDLLAMSNTDSDVFMDVKSQNYFMVISGRWYKAGSMTGKWEYITSDKLPPSFSQIPKDSEYGDVRSYVAGTDEAKEAVMDAQIPQTAAVKRGTVDIKVHYDGQPKFETIAGTDLKFAANCSETVIEAQKKYYLVKDAVWYIADTATGPWQVSDQAPPGIGKVPPSSPVYNTKYVYVYDSTPDVVYVGYTPGYVGSYIYGPTIVYGTGWYYAPWVSPVYYYPRPATWGFSVSYNPWTGWGFGMSWSSGPFHFGFYTGGGYHGPYWGPRWYGPGGYRPAFNQVNINNVNINVNKNTWNNFSKHNNLYRNVNQRATIKNTIDSRSISSGDRQNIKNRVATEKGGGSAVSSRAPGKISSGELSAADIRDKAAKRDSLQKKNNVLADKDGNVLRNHDGKWQQRTKGEWKNKNHPAATDSARSNIGKHSGYDRPSSLDRQQFSRQRSSQRAHQFHGRAGGMHGGGGRVHR